MPSTFTPCHLHQALTSSSNLRVIWRRPCIWAASYPPPSYRTRRGPLDFLTSGNPRNPSPLDMPGVMDGYDARGFLLQRETELGHSVTVSCVRGQRRKSHPADPSFGAVAACSLSLGGLVQAQLSGATMIDVPPRPEPYPLHDTPASLRYGVTGSLAARDGRFLWVEPAFRSPFGNFCPKPHYDAGRASLRLPV